MERGRADWKRRNNRTPASLTGAAYRSDGSWVRVHMTNISYEGCHLLSGDPLDVGETVTLVMPKTRHMLAQVRWVKDLRHGVRFLDGSASGDRRARIGV